MISVSYVSLYYKHTKIALLTEITTIPMKPRRGKEMRGRAYCFNKALFLVVEKIFIQFEKISFKAVSNNEDVRKLYNVSTHPKASFELF